ncbi:oxygenase MpaB family protein [Nocardioides sp.]|uniref:oxygenase MpaB family protein n=1 Tax=Nocardioides sp. TaxID=35761 RepID=UPI0035B4C225
MSLRERLGAELFQKVAGPRGQRQREMVHGSPGPRWFEPGSPIGRVHGDASMFVGGIRAIMLQSLHPAAMQGVADHSGYRGDMWGRLAQVATYIAVTTFGTEEHALRAIRAVQRAHASVTGTMPDGTPYDASDPHLLGWVHAAEIHSFLLAHDRFGHRPLVGVERDEYVAQTSVAAGHLGVLDPPQTVHELHATLAAYAPELRGTDAARDAIRFLVWHPDLPLAARPAYLSLVGAAVSLTPESARRELGLPHPPVLDVALDRTVGRALGKVSTGAIRWAMAPGHAHARALQEAARA